MSIKRQSEASKRTIEIIKLREENKQLREELKEEKKSLDKLEVRISLDPEVTELLRGILGMLIEKF